MVNMYIKALILFSHMLCCVQFNALFVRSVFRILHFPTLYTILGGPTEQENWGFTVFIIVYF
jgi:hypothetical protein